MKMHEFIMRETKTWNTKKMEEEIIRQDIMENG
jgi:hypothetical protein